MQTKCISVCFAGMGAEERHINGPTPHIGLPLISCFFFCWRNCVYIYLKLFIQSKSVLREDTSNSIHTNHTVSTTTHRHSNLSQLCFKLLSMLSVPCCATCVVFQATSFFSPLLIQMESAGTVQQIDSLGSQRLKVRTKYLFVNV